MVRISFSRHFRDVGAGFQKLTRVFLDRLGLWRSAWNEWKQLLLLACAQFRCWISGRFLKDSNNLKRGLKNTWEIICFKTIACSSWMRVKFDWNMMNYIYVSYQLHLRSQELRTSARTCDARHAVTAVTRADYKCGTMEQLMRCVLVVLTLPGQSSMQTCGLVFEKPISGAFNYLAAALFPADQSSKFRPNKFLHTTCSQTRTPLSNLLLPFK